jgi:NAD(P)-dependent dehydrogenase (short-subunit alcohol dehydrogenase family)
MARRSDLLAQSAPDVLGVPGDVQDEEACAHAVRETARQLGGIDAVVYATAVTHLASVEATAPADWTRILATNVVGFTHVMRHALPHLREGRGRVLTLSSDSVGHPFPGLGAYVASKAALESVMASWRVEHPELDVITVVAGPTATDAASAWDPALVSTYFDRWMAEGYVRPDLVPADPADVGAQIVEILARHRAPTLVDLAPPRPWADPT